MSLRTIWYNFGSISWIVLLKNSPDVKNVLLVIRFFSFDISQLCWRLNLLMSYGKKVPVSLTKCKDQLMLLKNEPRPFLANWWHLQCICYITWKNMFQAQHWWFNNLIVSESIAYRLWNSCQNNKKPYITFNLMSVFTFLWNNKITCSRNGENELWIIFSL